MHDLVQEELKRGSERAFNTVFHEHFSLLCAVAYGYVGDTEASQSIAEDALFTLWQRRDELLPLGSLRGWLMRTVRNRSIDHLRANPRGRLTALEETSQRCFISDDDLFELYVRTELQQHITDAIKALPPECRRVFCLSRNEGLSYSEIARRTGLSVNTVKYHIKNALATLRRELGPFIGEMLLLLYFRS